MAFVKFIKSLSRRKIITDDEMKKTKLKRCLTLVDLVGLGVGSSLGAGVYVVTGEVAKKAGPAVVLSFFIAAVTSIMAGLCFAELGARVPRTGSSYIYCYIAIGELMGFIIGWNLILEYIIGAASVARAWSSNFNAVTGGYIVLFFQKYMSMHLPGLADYVDLFAVLLVSVMTVVLSIGVKESSQLNNIFTTANISVITYTIICGFWNANFANWDIDVKNITNVPPNQLGTGYFMPFGIEGILTGAGTCFYAFVGFDCISTTGEEAKNPQRSIPLAIIITLLICLIVYSCISCAITLMEPYYTIDSNAPMPIAFRQIGWCVAQYGVGIGAIFGLSTSLMGAMFPLPRVVYAMANDGLIFRFLNIVSSRFKTPYVATIIAGILAATMAAMFNLNSLVDLMSIGTLLAYALVSLSVLILRVVKDPMKHLKSDEERVKLNEYVHYLYSRRCSTPDRVSSFLATLNSYIIFVLIIILNLLLVNISNPSEQVALLFFVSLFSLLIILFAITIKIQPESDSEIYFKVPLMPWLPIASMVVNLHLMMQLSIATWYRFIIWMVIGFVIYFGYSYWNSDERFRERQKLDKTEDTIKQADDQPKQQSEVQLDSPGEEQKSESPKNKLVNEEEVEKDHKE